MAENTKIEWADDSVSLWWGCTHRGIGCLNCYAETLTSRMHGKGKFWGPNQPRLYCKNWERTLRGLNKKAMEAGKPRVVFVNSMSDFFEDDRPLVGPKITKGDDAGMYPVMWHGPRKRNGVVDYSVVFTGEMLMPGPGAKSFLPGYRHATIADLRTEFFRVADQCHWLRLLLLTKRPENIRPMWADGGYNGSSSKNVYGYRDNVWLGTSAACQEDANRNFPALFECRDLAGRLFVSLEPLVSPVSIVTAADVAIQYGNDIEVPVLNLSDWLDLVIIGGESGPRSRPCSIDWIRLLMRECKATRVNCFVKQLGARPINSYGEHLRFEDAKGGDMEVWPEDLRVRQMPAL